MMLYQLAKSHQSAGITAKVVSLVSHGAVKPLLEAEGIEVVDLNFPRGRFSLHGFLALIREIRAWRPDLICCWMYHANIIGTMAAKISGNDPVIWGIHNTTLDKEHSSFTTRFVMRFGGVLSKLPAKIIYCSKNAMEIHQSYGYSKDNAVVIPNGFDVDVFHPDYEGNKKTRLSLNMDTDEPVIGIVGRYNPQKDFPNFIRAAKIIHQKNADVHFLLCGQGLTVQNNELMTLIEQSGIISNLYLLGMHTDMPAIYQSMDLLVSSSSYGEAFPMVIGEAMACGVPCVATDIGDARFMIGDSGLVVPPRDPQALADAVQQLLSLSPTQFNELQQAARQRIVENFSIESIAGRYQQLFEQVIRER